MEYGTIFFFLVFSFIIIVSALGVVLFRSIVHSAISLIVTFLSIGGLYILLNADFVAISQIIIYGVGITIILIFAIMLTGKKSDEKLWIAFAPRTLIALLTTGALFLTITLTITNGLKILSGSGLFHMVKAEPSVVKNLTLEGTAPTIGVALFTKYLLPFEILSILLLAVIIGAVVLARKDKDNLVNPTTEE